MKSGNRLLNGDQDLNTGPFYATAASVSYFAGYSAMFPPLDTVTETSPYSMIGSLLAPTDTIGGQLGYRDRKFAVVTGAASGIGLACVQRLQDFDYDLQLLDINSPKGSQIEQIDLSKEVPHLRRAPDVVVVSHGIGGLGNTWEKVFDVNVFGVRNVVEAAIKRMLEENKQGSIVLIASMTGPVVGNLGMNVSHYAASKGAVVGYMRQRAVELSMSNIRINAVCPGPVVSPMTDKLRDRDRRLYDEFFGRCLLSGYTTPTDIADAVMYLAHARRVTGQTLVVDGGYTIW